MIRQTNCFISYKIMNKKDIFSNIIYLLVVAALIEQTIWIGFMSENVIPKSISLILLSTPWLIIINKLRINKYKNYIWTCYVSLFYFIIGFIYIVEKDSQVHAFFTIIISLIIFFMSIIYVRNYLSK